MARINVENDRLDEAMKDYEKGYESVPGSKLPEDQKQTWLGRLRHGKARVLARMGKHQEAWAEAGAVRSMNEAGREAATHQVARWPYHARHATISPGLP